MKVDHESRSEFALSDKWFSEFRELVLSRLPPTRSEIPRRVRIAILDTGIDIENPYVPCTDGRVRGLRSFVGSDPLDIQDLCGHGTHVAGLVHKMAPDADIYIAKISRDGSQLEEECIVSVSGCQESG